jgi:hypothetical protein
MGVLVFIVTGQREGAAYSVGGDELLEQGSRKLNVLPGGAFNDDVAGCSTIIVQILVSGEAQVKLVSFHGIILCQQNPNQVRKQGCWCRELIFSDGVDRGPPPIESAAAQ